VPPTDILLVATVDAVGVTRLPGVLSHGGCRVTVLCASKLALRRSRFVHRWLEGPRDPREMMGALRQHLARHGGGYRHVIAADEPLLWVLRENAEDWMAPWFPAPFRGCDLDAVFSKRGFVAAASAHALPIPATRLCSSLAQVRQTASEFGFPLVLKADRGLSGSGVRVPRTNEQLEADFATLRGEAGLLVQQFVDGELGTTPVLFDRGRPVCWFSAYTREHWPTRFTSSTALEITDVADMEAILDAIGRITCFNGLCGLDWVEDPATKRIRLLELNPRPTPGLRLARRAGVDFSIAIRDWLGGRERVQRPRAPDGNPLFPMFPQALYRAIDDRRPSLAARAIADAPFRDPGLLAAQTRRVVTHYARQLLRK